jgi:anti-sigma-K factor RsiG
VEVIPLQNIESLLDPEFADGLDRRTDEELREMKSRCAAVETTLSYYRRLAQGRIEILEAWAQRRAKGGSLEGLVADLPQILAPPSSRPGTAQARLAEPAPDVEPLDLGGRERLVEDDGTLAELPLLDDETLTARIEDLRDFEREVSELRRGMHGVIDGVELELATRQAAGTAG